MLIDLYDDQTDRFDRVDVLPVSTASPSTSV
jgi:hypothetical protein